LKLITLLTDFGLLDGYPGILQGVILTISPDARIVDITHNIKPHDVFAGALALGSAAPYFPPGTIHIAVVDPGVGTRRRPLAARLGDQYFVGPDNGLMTDLLNKAEIQGDAIDIIHLNQPRFWLPAVSNVFHGRDIFAPSAAHLANGVPLSELGCIIHDPVRLQLPTPSAIPGGWRGQVIHIDHFGNLATNIESFQLQNFRSVEVSLGSQVIHGLLHAFGDGKPGDLLALIDSSGRLSLCVVNGSAEKYLNIKIGDPVEVVQPESS
jgi:S-adenosylmethionine hydrolase